MGIHIFRGNQRICEGKGSARHFDPEVLAGEGAFSRPCLVFRSGEFEVELTGETLDRVFEELASIRRYRECVRPEYYKQIDNACALACGRTRDIGVTL